MSSYAYEDRPAGAQALRLQVITRESGNSSGPAEIHTLQLVRGDAVMTNVTPDELNQVIEDYNDWVSDQ